MSYDYEEWCGDDWTFVVTVVDSDDEDVWLYDTTATYVVESLGGALAFTKTSADGDITIGNLNEYTITVESADTLSLAPGGYSHQLIVTDTDGDRQTLLDGQILLKRTALQ